MHLGVDDIFDLRLAASLHDIGKIRVPIEIIRKQGPLDDHEWAVMKQHSAIGAGIIANIGNDSLVESVRHHHERWDGSGYPDGISGREIPLHARIIAVSDAFDAITSNRSYRGKSNRKKAIEILKAQSGKQFDPEVVEAFLSALPRSLPGIAALSSLGFPAMRRVASEFSVIVRQAGAFGVAGAIATSGVTGVVATTVHPSKYLNGPAAVDNARSAATGERKDHSPSSAPGLVLGEILARPEDGPPATAGDGDRSARGTGRDAARTQRKRSRGKARSGGKARERATGKKTASGQNKGEEEKVAHAAPGKAKKAAKEAAAAATSATEASKPNPSKHDEGGDPDKTAADTVDEPAPAKGKPDKTEPTDVDGTVGNVEDEASEHGKGSGKDK
jgi:hypothetical protein